MIVTIANANDLAREFYRLMGYVREEDYRFDEATHPQEKLCWQMACAAFEHIEGTDLNEVLAEIEDQRAET